MIAAIFGFIGVLTGSAISFFQTYWISRRAEKKNANYLAIRMFCILRKYAEACSNVVSDDGLSCGGRNEEGYLEIQVPAPPVPIYPDDLDWKSIDPKLMYKILSFPSDVEAGNRAIAGASEHAFPPDYEEMFEERRFQYSQFGLTAFRLAEELASSFNIKQSTFDEDWNPIEYLENQLEAIIKKRRKRT